MPRSLVVAFLSAALWAQAPESRPTTPERTGFAQTSTHAEVLAFLETVKGPRVVVRNFGKSGEGKPLPVAIVSNPPCDPDGIVFDGRIRVLIVANIHGGEVEGKEAAQMLLRECAAGAHDDWLKELVLLVVPNFNPDGNDRIDKKNRVEQNGPDGGVGRRENAAGLDLNRDFVKLETPEAQALVALMNRFDPHALLDLHTTNGSFHGYHVTYATSQAPNVPTAIAKFGDGVWLPGIVAGLAKDHGFRAFPYGNVERLAGEQVWASFDHRPRFLTNYYGLRGRLSLLCEAYSYLPFERRIAVTRAFVAEAMKGLIANGDAVRKLTQAEQPARFGYATELVAGETREVLLSDVERLKLDGIGTRLVAKDATKPTPMRVRASFESKQSFAIPSAYALVEANAATTLTLLRHGLTVRVTQHALDVEGETFVPSEIQKASRSFQKHLTIDYRGRFEKRSVPLPIDTVVVGTGVLGAQLLDPQSEDSLGTWNHFETASRIVTEASDTKLLAFPSVRLATAASATGRLVWSSVLRPAGCELPELRPAVATIQVNGMPEAARFRDEWKERIAQPGFQVLDLATGSAVRGGVEIHVAAGAGRTGLPFVRSALEELGAPVVRIVMER